MDGAAPRVGGHGADDLADVSPVNAAEGFDVGVVGPRLEIDQVDQPLGRCLLARLGNGHATGDVYRHGFGQVDMLARVDRGRGLLRVEVRRRLDHHRVDGRVEQPLVGGERGEPAGGGDLEAVAKRLGPVREIIGAGDELVLPRPGEQIGNPGAAASAADHPQANNRVARAIRTPRSSRPRSRPPPPSGPGNLSARSHHDVVKKTCSRSFATYGPHIEPHEPIDGSRPMRRDLPVDSTILRLAGRSSRVKGVSNRRHIWCSCDRSPRDQGVRAGGMLPRAMVWLGPRYGANLTERDFAMRQGRIPQCEAALCL